MTDVQSFEEIYTAVTEKVRSEAARRKVRRPPLRHPSVADVSVLDVPRERLLGIDDDRDFVASVLLVLVDAAPSVQQQRTLVRRLREGEITREEVVDEVLASPRFVKSGRKVKFT